jgi:hypothetical protein
VIISNLKETKKPLKIQEPMVSGNMFGPTAYAYGRILKEELNVISLTSKKSLILMGSA